MKWPIIKLALPLTVISFLSITKWWHAVIVDAPDVMLYGFPFIYTCPGLHTSLSSQFFMLEFIADFTFYFICWVIILYLINKFIFQIKPSKWIYMIPYVIALLFLIPAILIASMPENVFSIKRDFDIELLDSGVDVIWHKKQKPDYSGKHLNN